MNHNTYNEPSEIESACQYYADPRAPETPIRSPRPSVPFDASRLARILIVRLYPSFFTGYIASFIQDAIALFIPAGVRSLSDVVVEAFYY